MGPVGGAAQSAHYALLDSIKSSWFLIALLCTAVYWVAKHDLSISDVQKIEARTTALENRAASLESGIAQLKLKLDMISQDLSIIKTAVMK
ncbi:MAG: hypothetical protein FWE17_02635 [Alphaproteobacteria bacterium]|nr:hypothetical protein [Alphaproteobacteria bacterium]MCL2758523.1 hypothetical protein [Alphaproteobacteria bacterium]